MIRGYWKVIFIGRHEMPNKSFWVGLEWGGYEDVYSVSQLGAC